jgi:hypothetical protein
MPSGLGNRRGFFQFLAREGVAWFDEARGRPQMRLSDLPELPPEALAELVPQILPGVAILPTDTEVRARRPGETETVALFQLEDTNLLIFNRFDGRATLGETVEAVSVATGLDRQETLARVRSLFLRVVGLRVCVPCNAGRPPEARRLDRQGGMPSEQET